MKKTAPNFKSARYVDIQKHWRKLKPFYYSNAAFQIWKPCMLEFVETKAGEHNGKYQHEEQERHKFPEGYECCDWRYYPPRRGRQPAFWKFVCHSACHWLADLNLFVAMSAWPEQPWRIITHSKHTTVWNGNQKTPLVYDANWSAFDSTADKPYEALETVWPGRHLRPGKFLKFHLHQI